MIDDASSPWAFAVRALAAVKLIDGGDTVDVRLIAADDRVVAVLIPRKVFKELQAAVLPDTNIDARR